MNARQPITIAIVAMLLLGAMAVVGAASPSDQANHEAVDAYEENAPKDHNKSESSGNEMNGSGERAVAGEDRPGNADAVGPSDGLPEQVPDHVSDIHATIESFLNDSIESLGEALSELLGAGNGANETAEENADTGAEVPA